MNAELRILNSEFYRCPNTDPFHMDHPTEDGSHSDYSSYT